MRTFTVLVTAFVLASGAGLAQAEGIEPVEGGWKGETRQGLPVYFGVKNGRVINTRYHFHWGFCGTYGSHARSAKLEIDPTGRWSIKDTRGSSFEGTFVAPNLVEGMVIVEERELPGCPKVSGDVAQRVIQVIDRQVNPAIAAHGGHAELVAIEEDTAYLRLGGGCQGCGMATVTLARGSRSRSPRGFRRSPAW